MQHGIINENITNKSTDSNKSANSSTNKLKAKLIGSQNLKIFLMNLKYEKDMKKIAMIRHIQQTHTKGYSPVLNMYESLNKRLNNLLTKQEAEIVIARYSENINWCHDYSNLITIYNKGTNNIPNTLTSIPLNNIGRESHTYLHHIISNWNNLADITFFGQGSLSLDHEPYPLWIYMQPKMETITINLYSSGMHIDNNNRLMHTRKYLDNIKNGKMKKAELDFVRWWHKYIKKSCPSKNKIMWSHGALFSVSRELIKSNSIEYYKNLITCLENHDDPEEGHYFERSWFYIFNCGHL
jgi:hypothetical protein